MSYFFVFFNDTATTEIYTLSLHDALPISLLGQFGMLGVVLGPRLLVLGELLGVVLVGRADVVALGVVHVGAERLLVLGRQDRKSTRLNSSHANISYAVFCLKKKKKRRSRT